jgi:outer membrane protein OmpA-like peptidoglycan-associated protein
MFRRLLMVVPVVAVAVAGSTACATKKFVRTEVGTVNDKVTTLSTTVEENQARTDERISEVDAKAGAADEKAAAAGSAATEARSAADSATNRAEEVDKSFRKLIYEVTLDEAAGKFKFDDAALPEGATALLDKMITDLQADPQAVWFEIEGHTDSTGSQAYNEKLGLQRAEAVKQYLYEQHKIPLHKMNVLTYGETKPVASNQTRDGRAENRRVVIKVVS